MEINNKKIYFPIIIVLLLCFILILIFRTDLVSVESTIIDNPYEVCYRQLGNYDNQSIENALGLPEILLDNDLTDDTYDVEKRLHTINYDPGVSCGMSVSYFLEEEVKIFITVHNVNNINAQYSANNQEIFCNNNTRMSDLSCFRYTADSTFESACVGFLQDQNRSVSVNLFSDFDLAVAETLMCNMDIIESTGRD
ncbi:MAG: hypothetical protein AAFV93_09330 [Chloroflexota bacterium]